MACAGDGLQGLKRAAVDVCEALNAKCCLVECCLLLRFLRNNNDYDLPPAVDIGAYVVVGVSLGFRCVIWLLLGVLLVASVFFGCWCVVWLLVCCLVGCVLSGC